MIFTLQSKLVIQYISQPALVLSVSLQYRTVTPGSLYIRFILRGPTFFYLIYIRTPELHQICYSRAVVVH